MSFCLCFWAIQYNWIGITQGECSQKIWPDEREPCANISSEAVPSNDGRTIYVITPTYRRPEQIAELTRLSQTLMHVPNLTWLVIEDEKTKTKAVERLLDRVKSRSGMEFVHLTAPMPDIYRNKTLTKNNFPRGVSSRNEGLKWLRTNANSGVFYFADDDNTYDIRIFEEMRNTKDVSMWPVGLLRTGFTSPVCKDDRVVGFYAGWYGHRKYAVDMASFAVSVQFLLQRPKARMPYIEGYEEDGFLRSLYPLRVKDIECKVSNASEILVWHTQTVTPSPLAPINMSHYAGTNIMTLYNSELQSVSERKAQ